MGDSEVLGGRDVVLPLPAARASSDRFDSLIESLRPSAIDALRGCCRPAGLLASGDARGHRQVWARDSMISLLGASLTDDPVIRAALLASLENLKRHRSPAGAIPNHIDIESGKANFRAYADGGLWYVIGNCILSPDARAIRPVLRWYECQDVDSSGLISIQEASDWQDLFCTRGKGLYVNCLRVLALDKAAALAENCGGARLAAGYRRQAEAARQAINAVLWYPGDGRTLRHVVPSFSTQGDPERDSLGRRRWLPPKRILAGACYYLPYVSFREIGEWFDSLGNLLAILAGVADDRQAALILDFIDERGLGRHPMRAIDPPVERDSPDWRHYYAELNLPDHYHNGGVWPFIGGFYVAALVKTGRYEKAEAALAALAELNQAGAFCEWHHGRTLEPMGVRRQAWSAAMFLYAAECVAARAVKWL